MRGKRASFYGKRVRGATTSRRKAYFIIAASVLAMSLGVGRDAGSGGLERLDLLGGRALAARDDGAGVAHALARRARRARR